MQMSSFLMFFCAVFLILGLYGCGGTNASTEATSMVVQAEASTGSPNAVVGEDGDTRLHIAAKNGDTSLVEELILGGANVDQTDDLGWTPLHEASLGGHVEIVKVLLAHGANVNQADSTGDTPLHIASHDDVEVVKVLLAHGADVNQTDYVGATPLDNVEFCKCSDSDKQAMIQVLRQAGGVSNFAYPAD
ncbi:MAG: ankyrin repeat domain-containing protein [Vampirovibrionales bacterium]